MKKIKLITVVMLIAALLTACGSKSSLVGRWEAVDHGIQGGWAGPHLSELEFFSDGTYVSSSDNYTGSYTIEGDRIKLPGVLMETLVATFDISGDTLTLYDDEGDAYQYTKVSD